jgi:hypothetical protein
VAPGKAHNAMIRRWFPARKQNSTFIRWVLCFERLKLGTPGL